VLLGADRRGAGRRADDTVDVVAIDHLPTLLPREASDRFANDLLPSFLALAQYETARVWQDALALFHKKAAEAASVPPPPSSSS
jgi:hypothetical protein